MPEKKFVAVIGASEASAEELKAAYEVGRQLARRGAVLICGGLGGVMEAACRGAKEEGGLTVGILPGGDRRQANPYVEIPIATGIGYARNAAVPRSAQVVIAIGGSYGTLSEIAFALQNGLPVIGIGTWNLSRKGRPDNSIIPVNTPQEAVEKAFNFIEG